MPIKKPFFSIVIPTLNEEKYLPLLLEDLSKQSYQKFEVVVVDSKSQDNTVNKAKSYKNKLNLKINSSKVKNVSSQRNTGAELSNGEWIIFMDADNRLPSYFLQGIKYQLEKNPQTDGFTCYIKTKDYPIKYKPLITTINIFTEIINSVSSTAMGAMIGVKKSIFKKIKFDEDFCFCEDVKFTRDIIKSNYNFKIFKEPSYKYSLRRLEKEGALKLIVPTAKIFIRNLGIEGKANPKDYPMLGGSYYQEEKTNFFHHINKFIRTAPKKQLDQARNIFKQIREFEF